MTFISEYEPQDLWRHFDQILTIPRKSKNEAKIREYVVGVAERNDLSHKVDAAGNVVVKKPGTAGREDAPVTIIQSHLDMVQEKNSDVDFDFSTDAIQPRREGDYLTATGTTLGSDNGIGVAAMLAILESDEVEHGPLELLFTIDEETGLTGAQNLDASMLEGRRLINLDSEEEGSLCVGCAGGADSTLTLPLAYESTPEGTAALRIRLHGMKGGHSGVDIHLQRGNALQLLARALHAVSLDGAFQLAAFEGGTAHNAVPREAFATVVVAEDTKIAFLDAFGKEISAIQAEFAPAEPEMDIEITDLELPARIWTDESAGSALRLLTALPHGVMAMSYDIPGLVETSTNLATVKIGDGAMVIGMSSRSSVASALTALRRKIRATAALAGAGVEEGNGYPGWQPDMDSELLGVMKELHEKELGTEPEVEAIHAGLECGLIGEMVPGMDMISFGPQIEFPHSPDERVKVDSVERFYRLLVRTLDHLSA